MYIINGHNKNLLLLRLDYNKYPATYSLEFANPPFRSPYTFPSTKISYIGLEGLIDTFHPRIDTTCEGIGPIGERGRVHASLVVRGTRRVVISRPRRITDKAVLTIRHGARPPAFLHPLQRSETVRALYRRNRKTSLITI